MQHGAWPQKQQLMATFWVDLVPLAADNGPVQKAFFQLATEELHV
jgi:hypothetical protein